MKKVTLCNFARGRRQLIFVANDLLIYDKQTESKERSQSEIVKWKYMYVSRCDEQTKTTCLIRPRGDIRNQGSDQFISVNSIQFQFKLDSGFFNSIQFKFKLDSESFNSIPIQFIFFQFQFNSIFMHRNKQINQLIEYFKFNLNISLFAAQFRKYIIQDHNNSRINKSALVQVLG